MRPQIRQKRNFPRRSLQGSGSSSVQMCVDRLDWTRHWNARNLRGKIKNSLDWSVITYGHNRLHGNHGTPLLGQSRPHPHGLEEDWYRCDCVSHGRHRTLHCTLPRAQTHSTHRPRQLQSQRSTWTQWFSGKVRIYVTITERINS